ncbi:MULTISPECIES: catabolite repressor/activator [unclassified Salinicola]|uniref:catabolite repressor/activator n=1 Tax=unclassified Salinicola TaxID=2634022 RepID=UPI001A8F59F5|nr:MULTISPECIES: catabolite repressor/activator [unclassified Salinicola]MCE3026933.1 catabolite repressor/activator [Salinicola sp. DM10]WIX32098.1 catabolite repressor/activator [Salinicola sp. JS01]
MKLADIARLAGVSRTTASYVLNGQARARRISEATVERVLTVARDHDYRIDAQAAALRGGDSRTLGLIVPDLENGSYARLAKRLEHGARSQGYQLLIVGSDDDPERERTLARSLRAQRCDALIVASSLAPDDDFYAELLAAGLPVIAVDRPLDPQHFISVVTNGRSAGEALTRSVLDPDVNEIVWFDAVPQLSISTERRQGFLAACRSFAGEYRCISAARYDRASGAAAMRQLLGESRLPDAIVTASYTLLDGLLDALLERGALPTGLRLATFGDDRLLDFLPCRVNSLPQDHDRVAAQALARALQAVRGDYRPGLDVIERTLKRRR